MQLLLFQCPTLCLLGYRFYRHFNSHTGRYCLE
jgi:hypothetical protein